MAKNTGMKQNKTDYCMSIMLWLASYSLDIYSNSSLQDTYMSLIICGFHSLLFHGKRNTVGNAIQWLGCI